MINRHSLQAILDYVDQKGLSEQTLTELRGQFPDCQTRYLARLPS